MILRVQCEDQPGLVATLSGILAGEGLNIVSLREHVDRSDNRFYLRLEATESPNPAALEGKVLDALPAHSRVEFYYRPVKAIAILVTREHHCLADLLVRHAFGTLNAEVNLVIGNHPDLQGVCKRFDVPFVHLRHEGKQDAFEHALSDLLSQYRFDYLVLAKFMRILSEDFVARWPMKIINIHHSFLPAFAGANPYRQACERGVKLIGATAHFVTADLDEGPIIAQQTQQVSHSFELSDVVRAGHEVETAVLSRALSLVFDERVFVYRNRTIVFER